MSQKQRSNKELILLILFIAVVCLGVLNFTTIVGMAKSFMGMIKPFVIGLAIAFVVNLPMKFVEEKMLGSMPEKLKSTKRTLGIVLSFLFFAAVIAFVCNMKVDHVRFHLLTPFCFLHSYRGKNDRA